ncbi:hypothetical protein [Clostridium saccharobutylicum]|uniref:Uncharacterized protein n=1 Tax=Clostridium saccharobutylicum DSM 13864 TaxID=1345695 RepID=U5MT53_CLOSA|nr:hypothetical protein [Clostridium saccharobutylicum]AGX43929.1 hypothetical protein CLSA_c29620 [Clostridium saccharobutylicum DSM 13864]AQR91226.1 hypothetical protein CLOSC_29500 [Clostridium saccharobutylicum]AQS01130.1 hypothetical protein CSACC_29570 [Clostridium saccharobutylicum]AQS15113.1 hypothetical protein CLOSACC_29570 [Clostridium saccharobutylicum]MBA2905239.1 hypothetical protein [Clostridium saccharobutylicum]
MARQKSSEKPIRKSFTLNSDNNRDRVIRLYLSNLGNEAEFMKNIIYDYIMNNGVKNDTNDGSNINTNIKIINKDTPKNDIKNDTMYNNDVKIDTNISTNIKPNGNFIINIDDSDDEIVEIKKDEEKEQDEAFSNALNGLGV